MTYASLPGKRKALLISISTFFFGRNFKIPVETRPPINSFNLLVSEEISWNYKQKVGENKYFKRINRSRWLSFYVPSLCLLPPSAGHSAERSLRALTDTSAKPNTNTYKATTTSATLGLSLGWRSITRSPRGHTEWVSPLSVSAIFANFSSRPPRRGKKWNLFIFSSARCCIAESWNWWYYGEGETVKGITLATTGGGGSASSSQSKSKRNIITTCRHRRQFRKIAEGWMRRVGRMSTFQFSVHGKSWDPGKWRPGQYIFLLLSREQATSLRTHC